jgi:hypothetical protein
MSIKNLFGKTVRNIEDVAQDVESTSFLDQVSKKRETYIPPIDFSDPSNFVFYGSAELYYQAAIRRIYEDYPYDGSRAEQIEFEEKASHLERWLFENKYPKSTGHVQLGTTADFGSIVNNIALTNTPEYIRVWGGLHTRSSNVTLSDHFESSTRFDDSKNRNQNWNCDFDKGITIEFWMKKDSFDTANNPFETILDLWNGADPSIEKRVVIGTTAISGPEVITVSVKDGTTLNNSAILDISNLSGWNHFAFTIYHENDYVKCDSFVNGASTSTTTLQTSRMNFSGKIDGFLGALQAEFDGAGGQYAGKFQGYLDEFRFWKTRRTHRQIKLNWFREVGGGANTDDNTTDLGVYLKFNEGITGDNSIDSVVLDYSGRVANGKWIGYPGSSARSTDSALMLSGHKENPSPIIYSNHPDVVSLELEMINSGSQYDEGRGESFYKSLPQWLVNEDRLEGDENLRKIAHILASYMDTLRVQIDALSTMGDKRYTPTDYRAAPFASELLKNKGFIVSDMFLSADVIESFSNLDYDSNQYDLDTDEIKNIIYTNIYNNLEDIYSSKGTEKSIRNLIRCFGIDDELLRLNQYTDMGKQYLGNKYRNSSVRKKYINLNSENHFSGSMFQSGARTFISGALEASVTAFSLEADIVVPHKQKIGQEGFVPTPFLSASIMGFHEANPTTNSDYTWWADGTPTSAAAGSISMLAVEWNNGAGDTNYRSTVEITSTDGTKVTYEFSLTAPNASILPNGNTAVLIGASLFDTGTDFRDAINSVNGHNGLIVATYSYQLLTLTQSQLGAEGNTTIVSSNQAALNPTNFSGGATTFGEARDLQVYLVRDSNLSDHAKFVIKNETETIYEESDYVYDIYDNQHYNVALRIKPQTYPHSDSVTNTTPTYDIELYAVTHNFDEIKEEVLISTTVDNVTGSAYLQRPKRIYAGAHCENFTGSVIHATDLEFGRVSAWMDYLGNQEIREHNKDILNYGLRRSLDGANGFATGDVQIPTHDLSILNWDFDTVNTSDSLGEFTIDDTTSGSTDTIYGWPDNIVRRIHDGKGVNFPTSSSDFLENEFLFAKKKQLPEMSYNSDNIFIKNDEEINFGEDEDVGDNLFILEKSPAAIVSEEMLKLFSTTKEFSNLFGRHVERYRMEYKDLNKARSLFYEKVEDGIDFDKFFTYFKWIDKSLSEMIYQLIPASVNFAEGVTDVVESHILERSKYQRQVGLLKTVTSTEASMRGVQELSYNYRLGRAPLPSEGLESNSLWQKERRKSDTAETEEIRKVLVRQNDQESTNPIMLSGSSGIYSGSTYAVRRFSRPVRPSVEFSDSIHSGINYQKTKNRDLFKSGIGNFSTLGSSGAPKNIVTFGAGLGVGLESEALIKNQDALGPNEKYTYDGFGIVGKFTDFANVEYPPLNPSLDYYSRRKISHIFPGNIVSSSVTTGYSSLINKSGSLGGYKTGVDVVNLHSDTTDITNEIPIQGPYTDRWVGGRQSRHVDLNSVGKPTTSTSPVANGLDSMYSRPEEYRFLIGKNPIINTTSYGNIDADNDGAIGFTAPDYGVKGGSFPDTDRLSAIYYREERVKRPLSVKNIQTTTSSVYHGNYQHEYEVFSTFGDQGYFLRRADNLLPDSITEILPETTNYNTLIAQTASISGNYFGEGNNRQYETVEEVSEIKSFASFTFHEDNTGIQPDAISPLEIDIQRAVGPSITFKVAPNGGGTSGTIVGGITVVDTYGTTWATVGEQFKIALESANGFGSNVSVSYLYDASGPDGERVIIAIREQTLTGIAGDGGLITESSQYIELVYPTFQGGVDYIPAVNGNIIDSQDRSIGSAHVIRTKFSAPGGPEINSSGYLDVATQQYSVHNSINFRNLTVRGRGSGESGSIRVVSHSNRREGLRTLRARHQGKFGIDSQYSSDASFHKQHRNGRYVAGFTYDQAGQQLDDKRLVYDNDHINSTLPASDFQYSWINSAISGSNWRDDQIILTYAPKNGLISSSIGITEAIVFPSASSFYGE